MQSILVSINAQPVATVDQSQIEGDFPSVLDVCETRREHAVVFFRPVDTNFSHHTFLGSMRKFDFLAQIFLVTSCERSSTGKINRVVIRRAHGKPRAVQLSHMAYASLSAQLHVWKLEEAGYYVCEKTMQPGPAKPESHRRCRGGVWREQAELPL